MYRVADGEYLSRRSKALLHDMSLHDQTLSFYLRVLNLPSKVVFIFGASNVI